MTLQDFDIRFCIYGDWQYSDSGVAVVSNIIVYKDIVKLNMEMDASWINISQRNLFYRTRISGYSACIWLTLQWEVLSVTYDDCNKAFSFETKERIDA